MSTTPATRSADLAFAGLARQARLVRDGEVTARELVELSLERIQRFDGELNAFAAVYAEQAPAEAGDPRPGPLSGVPIAGRTPLITGRLTGEVRHALRDTAALLRDLGHTVVERDLDLKPRGMPVTVALMLRGIRDIVASVERPHRPRGAARGRPLVATSSPTDVRLLAWPAAWRCAGSARES